METHRYTFRGKTTTFRDREDAGRRLAEALAPLVARPCVVAAIPRGGVSVALPVVERLAAPLTVVYARKLTAPIVPELAFGALDEDGQTILDEEIVRGLGLFEADVESAKKRVAAEITRRMALYRVPPLSRFLPDAGVVFVDDGLATGLTMRAAVAYARRHGARDVTVAVPCASSSAARRFQREADHLVSLVTDEAFMAVGAYYDDFSPVSDAEVVAMLERAQRSPVPGR
jgi:putative phosphoribosyl transferase